MALSKVKNVILVLSGKGGVGKSTVSAQIGISLRNEGRRVGILDIDLCGPSIPRVLGIESAEVHSSDGGWIPVHPSNEDGFSVMSLAFLLRNRSDPVIWRGPKKSAIIKQFLTEVVWGELDFLIIDTPPGTSDEHLTVVELLQSMKTHVRAVIVTTPQGVALSDVQKQISFCRRVGLPIIGLIENMSGYLCPHCEECTYVFGEGGGRALATEEGIEFLGRIPISPQLLFGVGADDPSSIIASHTPSRFQVLMKEAPSMPTLTELASRLSREVDVSPVVDSPNR